MVIPKKTHSAKSNSWQSALINAITDPKELLTLLELDMNLLSRAKKATALFPMKVTREFVSRIEKGNLNDPLLQQILPLAAEHEEHPDFKEDALSEKNKNPLPGLLHKYHGRVLLTLTGACGVNCRFCFRRYFPYHENNPGKIGWHSILDYIKKDSSIQEVILSGGDPLIMNDTVLAELIDRLSHVTHVQRLRIHTRLPIVLPQRITPEFIQWFTSSRLKPILVIHCNHPNEIDEDVKKALQSLHRVTLLNQGVLLKGVNDDPATLVQLSIKLFENGVLPYYLNVLDKVRGTAHFRVPLLAARQLHWEMAQQLSGYLVPRLVCEQAGAPAKLTLGNFEFYTG